MNPQKPPLPLFDSLDNIKSCQPPTYLSTTQKKDFSNSLKFLQCYTGSTGTYNSYRREIERLLHWIWLLANKNLKTVKREDIENFVRFCQDPPKTWIGIKKVPKFIEKDGLRLPNPDWRPFVATISKAEHRRGERPDTKDFDLSQGAIKELFAILSTFYNYLVQEEYVGINPVTLIRQKSKFIRRQQGPTKIRRLSELQWQYVIHTATKLSQENPAIHARTLFIMSAFYSMYLRISELAASIRWTPVMNHFARDSDGNWWFTTVGKGNKLRQIAVSDDMLVTLKNWRQHLRLSPLPSPGDTSPLLPKTKGKGPITNTSYIRKIVQYCFDQTIAALQQDNQHEEAASLIEATVHWLRHTGISDDVKVRPREHVRDDAGHSSSATTDKYIDVELRARHNSAKHKKIYD